MALDGVERRDMGGSLRGSLSGSCKGRQKKAKRNSRQSTLTKQANRTFFLSLYLSLRNTLSSGRELITSSGLLDDRLIYIHQSAHVNTLEESSGLPARQVQNEQCPLCTMLAAELCATQGCIPTTMLVDLLRSAFASACLLCNGRRNGRGVKALVVRGRPLSSTKSTQLGLSPCRT